METRPNPEGATAAAAVGQAATRAHHALDAAVDRVTPTVNRMVDKAHDAIERVAERATPAAENVETTVKSAADRTLRLAEACDESIRRRPLAAVAGALAVGYLLGRLHR
jgi:ElaB/YqjD/DUF883 family membrane-anchored ribosome-binding protein